MGKFNRGKIMIPGLDEVGPDTVIENQTERGKGLGSGLLSNVSQLEKTGLEKSMFVRFDELVTNPKNKMSISELKVKELADSIKNVGLLDPLGVIQLPDGRWQIFSGETRYRAISLLREQHEWNADDLVEVKPKYLDEILPELEDDTKEMYLLLSGNVNRDKTDADRAFEIQAWKKIIEDCRKRGIKIFHAQGQEDDDEGIQIAGRKTRDIIAQQTGMSRGLVGQYEQVENNGSEALKEALLNNQIPVHLAAGVSKMPKPEQEELVQETLKEKGESDRIEKADIEKYAAEKEKKDVSWKKIDAEQIRTDLINPIKKLSDFEKKLSESKNISVSEKEYKILQKKLSELDNILDKLLYGLR